MPSTSLHVFGTTIHCLDPAFPLSWNDLCDPVNCREEGKTQTPFLPCHRTDRERSSCFRSWMDSLVCVLALNIWLVLLQGRQCAPSCLGAALMHVYEKDSYVSSTAELVVFYKAEAGLMMLSWCCPWVEWNNWQTFESEHPRLSKCRSVTVCIFPLCLCWHKPLCPRREAQPTHGPESVWFQAACKLRHRALS